MQYDYCRSLTQVLLVQNSYGVYFKVLSSTQRYLHLILQESIRSSSENKLHFNSTMWKKLQNMVTTEVKYTHNGSKTMYFNDCQMMIKYQTQKALWYCSAVQQHREWHKKNIDTIN